MTDWGGAAQVITALGVLVTALFSGTAMVLAALAKKQSTETHVAVNSRMDEFKKLFESKFRMEGAADEKDAQRVRDTTIAATVAATGPALIVAAETKAQALIAEATLAAARVLAEAHHVSVTNLPGQPVPVQVVGPGVDTPLKVIPVTKKKRT